MNRMYKICIAGLALSGALVLAGPLNPPAGPVAPTMKTLTEVEPRTAINAVNTPGGGGAQFNITQPGSYYLTGNITGINATCAIYITSSNVTIDLNGFTISGGNLAINAPGVAGSLNSITVRNGVVTSCLANGISLGSTNNAIVEDVRVSNAAATGIVVGPSSQVRRCTVRGGGDGFSGYGSALFEDCTAAEGNGNGFSSNDPGGVWVRCIAANNGGGGFNAPYAQRGQFVSCVATSNAQHGFRAGDNFTFTGCTAAANQMNGFDLGTSNSIEGCVASHNILIGIETYGNCSVRNCQVNGNGQQGVHAQGGHCLITGNDVTGNGGSNYAGLWLDSDSNRCEDNTSSNNGFGLYIGGTANFVARNTFSGNTATVNAYAIGNHVAPIVSNPGSNGFSTAAPWSNFSY
jgi:parallel beta-helix repeat protein